MDSGAQSELTQAALQYASDILHPAILNHSLRVYLHAMNVSAALAVTDRPNADLLLVACLFHDAGTVSNLPLSGERFEVVGADAAADFLAKFEVHASDIRRVWTAISLHTSAGIAERMEPLTRALRLGVRADFGTYGKPLPLKEFDALYPRLDIERVLGDLVVERALLDPRSAPGGSWAFELHHVYESHPFPHGQVNPAF